MWREGVRGSGGGFLCLLPDDYDPSSATSLLPHDDDTRHEDNDDPTTSDKTDIFPPKPLTSELQIFSLTPTHTLTLMFFLSFSDTPRWIAEMAIGKLKVSSPYFRRLTILFWMMKSAGPEQELAAVWWRLTNFVWRLFCEELRATFDDRTVCWWQYELWWKLFWWFWDLRDEGLETLFGSWFGHVFGFLISRWPDVDFLAPPGLISLSRIAQLDPNDYWFMWGTHCHSWWIATRLKLKGKEPKGLPGSQGAP